MSRSGGAAAGTAAALASAAVMMSVFPLRNSHSRRISTCCMMVGALDVRRVVHHKW